ncbi:MAG: dTMP kinase [Lachnospiraceae bacterium]|nr:dTMP kinase [Lachnospiraceae bacterium]
MKKGIFIAFEGIDGSGKSTQIQLLMKKIEEKSIRCYQTCEPSSGPIGSLTRQILTGRIKTDNRVIAAMFAADRLDHLLNPIDGIVSKIEEGIHVISDRYYFSSYAYHSVDVPMDWVIKTNEESAKVLRPDLTVFIDISAKEAMDRITKNRFHTELFEKESRLSKVRENYLKAFELMKEEEKVLIVDGTKTPQEIGNIIWQAVEPML